MPSSLGTYGLVCLAIVFPPLAVCVAVRSCCRCPQVGISILFTFLFIVPGVVYAIVIVCNREKYREEEPQETEEVKQKPKPKVQRRKQLPPGQQYPYRAGQQQPFRGGRGGQQPPFPFRGGPPRPYKNRQRGGKQRPNRPGQHPPYPAGQQPFTDDPMEKGWNEEEAGPSQENENYESQEGGDAHQEESGEEEECGEGEEEEQEVDEETPPEEEDSGFKSGSGFVSASA